MKSRTIEYNTHTIRPTKETALVNTLAVLVAQCCVEQVQTFIDHYWKCQETMGLIINMAELKQQYPHPLVWVISNIYIFGYTQLLETAYFQSTRQDNDIINRFKKKLCSTPDTTFTYEVETR